MSSNSEVYNKDEIDPPEWLNADFLTTVLQSCEQDDTIQIKTMKITPATLQGDHYASVMFRARIEYESEEKTEPQSMSLIIKMMPELEGTKKELLGDSYLFDTEIGVYNEVIPKIESILRTVGDSTVLGPRCLYSSLAPKKIIIFEDLVPHGYKVLPEVSMVEVKAAFLKLAKFHAVSYKIHQEDPASLDKYRHSLTSLPNMVDGELFTSGISNFIEMLDTQPTLLKYKPYFEALQPALHRKYKASFDEYQQNRQNDALYVLSHGDFHVKNMMFKHNPENGRYQDVLLLDFQLSHIGPIINDVIYGTYLLLNREMRRDHCDEILYFYFSNFTDTLRLTGYKGRIPKLIEFRQMLLRHRHLDIFYITTFLPYVSGFFGGEVDPEDMMTNADFRKTVYRNKQYIEELEELLPRLLHMGYLDS